MASGGGGVWLEFHLDPEWAQEFHDARMRALPFSTQKETDVHLTVLYLGKEVTDKQAEILWKEGILPYLDQRFFKDFVWKDPKKGSWSPPEVVMIDVVDTLPGRFETLYRAFYAKALELGIKVAGTNTSPDKHNGMHVTIDKRASPPYSHSELDAVNLHMGLFKNVSIFWEDVRLVRGDSTNILWSYRFD